MSTDIDRLLAESPVDGSPRTPKYFERIRKLNTAISDDYWLNSLREAGEHLTEITNIIDTNRKVELIPSRLKIARHLIDRLLNQIGD